MELNFEILGPEINTRKSRVKHTALGPDMAMIKVEHSEDEALKMRREIDQSLIQIYFAYEGGAEFAFHGGSYKLKLEAEKNLLFYNPLQALPMEITVEPKSKLLFLYVTVERLHRMFVEASEELAFINPDNVNKKFYSDGKLEPSTMVALSQMFQVPVHGPAQRIFEESKVFEILAWYFNRREGTDVEACPFLENEDNVQKIRLAKKILIERMTDPPTIPELALEVGLNEYRLKEGFKNIYATTVFKYLNDYRLDVARQVLDEGKVKVNEVAYHIGYTNPSHFIAAFRKKFGVTPKKYLMNR
ncbi:helix-turn-helix transcriptional regulator [Croceimicrobium hydrocarbonivorans]|uniref:Helix-turn-helix transcriptional regulator n=1 Tax=Croceimicrobium hydrocarbonivorans TaxID=2761580 RepID=A0A7H0VGR8_9FLAO|nr:AraC family transcriptional regulator [Croceimicrobium hydrocarbonivorans]QNR24916.1 helix-turn-helix transcriptional regulator [Croceimicrobium hydrocarbonivorans]